MKKGFIAFIAIAALTFATAIGQAEKKTSTVEQFDRAAVSSNHP